MSLQRVWEHPRITEATLTFLGNLFLPRLSHRLRWRTRLGPRGTALYVGAWVAFRVAFMWAASKLARIQEQARAELRAQLGREPTTADFHEYFQGHC
jgi:hypothetical protein